MILSTTQALVTEPSAVASARTSLPRLPLPLYPTVLGLAIVTELFIASGVSPFSALRTFIVASAILLGMTLIGRVVLGDRDRGALAAALGILALMAGVDLRALLVVALGILALFAERYVLPDRYRTIRWPRITTIMTRLTAVLALAVAIHALQAGTPGVIARALVAETALRPPVTAPASAADPDIYMILLDGRARADVLSEHFGVDGWALTSALEDRGFSVASNSRSNYTLTTQVLASMFEMRHLIEIPRMAGLLAGSEDSVQGHVLRDVINDNAVFDTLRSRGYLIEAISSGWEEVTIREADRFIDTGELNEFEVGMLRRTTAGDILQIVAPDFVSAQYRSRIERAFEAVLDEAGRPVDRPVLVFAHVPSPHPPWVFGADGSPRTVRDLEAIYADTPASTGLSLPELRHAYGEQVIDADRRLVETLDSLDHVIADRGRPAVIIALSDHGSWIDADGGDIRLRFKNLLAVKSTVDDLTIDDDATTVNLFPSLFAQVFSIDVNQVPDTLYRFGARDFFELVSVRDLTSD